MISKECTDQLCGGECGRPVGISKDDCIWSGVVGYFPNALAAIGRWSKAGNEKHNPGESMHWAFGKSTAHLDAALSHLTQAGRIDPETGTPHLVNAAWRVLAALETSLIEGGAQPGVNVRGAPERKPALDVERGEA